MRENYDVENKKPLQIGLEELDKEGDTPCQDTEAFPDSKEKRKEGEKIKEKKEEKTIIDLIGRKRKNENRQSKENNNITQKMLNYMNLKTKMTYLLIKKK